MQCDVIFLVSDCRGNLTLITHGSERAKTCPNGAKRQWPQHAYSVGAIGNKRTTETCCPYATQLEEWPCCLPLCWPVPSARHLSWGEAWPRIWPSWLEHSARTEQTAAGLTRPSLPVKTVQTTYTSQGPQGSPALGRESARTLGRMCRPSDTWPLQIWRRIEVWGLLEAWRTYTGLVPRLVTILVQLPWLLKPTGMCD